MNLKQTVAVGKHVTRLEVAKSSAGHSEAEIVYRSVTNLQDAETSKDITGRKESLLVVPSCLVPVYNAVLYPGGGGFQERVSIVSVEPFSFHEALFPEIAKVTEE